jgi:hypothetical protein
MARKQKSAATRSSVALVWVANHAQIWGRAVELAYDRYLEAMKHRPASVLDSAVEFHLWMASMRMLWRIADRARTDLHLSTIDAAVAAFEQEVDTSELIALRDISQHADDYAVGLGRHPLKAYTADMDRWTEAAQRLRVVLHEAGKPRTLTFVEHSQPRGSAGMRRPRFPAD